ncbi:23S rRNA (uracil(1939)-C(5))-methyltransferase RlmD [Agarivorans sp. TSD2052]|uniref:23S rRNA (uracil(1939)-C(5))-methyltransferase RlmD n=1 Tax=Agarivorans sp. TSD2052 TaxID=2937286 RepID=UPI002010AB54|nr:23S rRNA (uracil(1939)-C(5))-methyltransferase RlmD [Agarivorans sp. TSD2052]UPW17423.1 23S rRNA (uracil(1939)-C(5))-methyltransferase RlmD [Agarivorans sp. TSD2052]
MAQFFKAKPKSIRLKAITDCTVTQLDHHLHGVVKAGRETYFVADALPGEQIKIQPAGKSGPAKLLKRLTDAEQRIVPRCQFYRDCGGCSVQHLTAQDQRSFKQTAVASLISRLSAYEDLPEVEQEADQEWHYRRVSRLSTWFDNKQGWLVGFRQKASKQLTPISECMVLTERLSCLIVPLQHALRSWPKAVGLGHIDLIDCEPMVVCRIRLTKALASKWVASLSALAEQLNIALLLVEADKQQWLRGEQAFYQLDEQQLKLAFTPGDFIQVNASMNQKMVNKAIEWLELGSEDVVLDLYSGIGNFSLAMAQHSKQVIAVEGVAQMSEQLLSNAKLNGLTNILAYTGDLEDPETAKHWKNVKVSKVLLDPARAGAKLAISEVAKLSPSTLVYVSCNPATLARDAKVLNQAGYKLVKLALIDMFAHTEHVETMALFTR